MVYIMEMACEIDILLFRLLTSAIILVTTILWRLFWLGYNVHQSTSWRRLGRKLAAGVKSKQTHYTHYIYTQKIYIFNRTFKLYHYRKFEDLSCLMSEENNWKVYRAELHETMSKGACVPFLGQFLTQILHPETMKESMLRRRKLQDTGQNLVIWMQTTKKCCQHRLLQRAPFTMTWISSLRLCLLLT